jgi:predicted RNA binding protein YcfA (HicA-like mRNA interferase family)
MPLRPLPYRQVERRLRAAGFVPVATHGSHVEFLRATAHGSRAVIVPRHRELAIGTLRSIIRQAGLTVAEFEALGD